MEEKKRYEIGEKVYYQAPLVLGQIRQLLNLLKDFRIPKFDINTLSEFQTTMLISDLLGDKLSQGLAIVLSEEGTKLKNKNLIEMAKELEFSILPDTAMEVISDFFVCNPIVSLLEKVNQWAEKLQKEMGMKIKLNISPSSSPEEILPEEMTSSGDSPSRIVSPS